MLNTTGLSMCESPVFSSVCFNLYKFLRKQPVFLMNCYWFENQEVNRCLPSNPYHLDF